MLTLRGHTANRATSQRQIDVVTVRTDRSRAPRTILSPAEREFHTEAVGVLRGTPIIPSRQGDTGRTDATEGSLDGRNQAPCSRRPRLAQRRTVARHDLL